MTVQEEKKHINHNKGFTLIELLVVIAVISLLTSVLLPKLNIARAKADDARRIASLKAVQGEIILQTDAGTAGYSSIFSSGAAKTKLDTLVSQTGVTGTQYDAQVSADGKEFAIVFPLKKDPTKYWCIDSLGISQQVSGRLSSTGAKLCSNATAGPTNNPPVIALIGDTPCTQINGSPTVCHGATVYTGNFTYKGNSVFGVLPSSFSEPSHTATDTEDGNITANVLIEYNWNNGYGYNYQHQTILTILKNIFTIPTAQAIGGGGGGGCLATTTRHYYVTDSNGNTAHAYRIFESVC